MLVIISIWTRDSKRHFWKLKTQLILKFYEMKKGPENNYN